MCRKVLMIFIVTVFALSMANVLTAAEGDSNAGDTIEKRVEALEKKLRDKEYPDEEQKTWKEHIDKHITHAEETMPRTLGGLSVAAGVTMVGQGTIGNDENAAGEDVIDGSISADLEISAPIAGVGEAFLALEAGDGRGLDGDEIDSFYGVNADAGVADTVKMIEAWYEQTFHNALFTLTLGKLDITNYFDANDVANDETTQFLSTGFVNNIAIEFPDNSVGVRFMASPLDMLDISVGVQSGDSDWEDIADKPFLIVEAVFKPGFGGLIGNYRVNAWNNRSEHKEIKDPSHTRARNWGVGVSIDQKVMKILTLFARLGYQDDSVNAVDVAVSAGGVLDGSLWGRSEDMVGVATGHAFLSDDFEDAETNTKDERHVEIYYRMFVNKNISVTPDIQVMNNAKGDDGFGTVLIGGVRGQLTF